MKKIAALLVLAAGAAAANAGTVTADYALNANGLNNLVGVNFSTNLPGYVGGRTDNSLMQFASRTDLPAGPGVDTYLPQNFNAFCVEIGEGINVPSNTTHLNVVPLLGSTTTGGGISGPVFFDAVRTANMQTLWGSFFGLLTNSVDAAAFQLATWNIAFDNDLTLTGGNVWVDAGQFQPGVTDLAESMLGAIASGAASTQQELFLLTDPGVQDLISTPAPGAFALAGIGALAAARRRR